MLCADCSGRGYVEIDEKCRVCNGIGKAKSFDPKTVSELSEDQLKMFLEGICGVCRGSGRVTRMEICNSCNGTGKAGKCKICGKDVAGGYDLCNSCRKKPHAYLLKNSCGIEDVKINKIYVGRVSEITDIGVFVNLNKRLKGFLHKRKLGREKITENEQVFVKVENIRLNGDIDLALAEKRDYTIIETSKDVPIFKISEINSSVGRIVEVRGKVEHVKLTGGPTIFTIIDGTGLINCAAFEAGERAYPEINVGDVVKVIGIVKRREAKLQIEVLEMERLLGKEATEIEKLIERKISEEALPLFRGFMVESEILNRLKDSMMSVAKELKKAVLESRPVIIRHHWDADGVCGGVALEIALLDYIDRVHPDPDAKNYLVRRKVSRAPFYELEDVVKDLDESLEDMAKFGDKIPLVVLVDNGSGVEDIPAIEQMLIFGADVITIDHHFPDEDVDRFLLYHVNPYKAGGDSNYTSGILCTEIARMITSRDLKILPAISVVADRAEGAVEKYIKLSGYDRETLHNIGLALEFEGFYLRFRSASQIVHEILGFGRKDRMQKLVTTLSSYAKKAIEENVKTAMSGVKIQVLPNGVVLAALDVENYARKFTFPPPGKLTGEVHDRLKEQYDKIVTLGYGPDFAVIRSEGVNLDIPRIVKELQEEINAGVDGGGHLVVGSLKFIQAKRKEVLARLAAKIGSI